MNRTPIEWTDLSANPLKYRDAAGNVVWGCVHASPGCKNCYSEAQAHRYRRGGPFNVPTMNGLTPFLDDAELHKMLTAKTIGGITVSGSRCFIGDMTDIFGEWVPDALLDKLFAVLALRSDVTWQILTKRAARMRAYCSTFGRHHEVDRVSLAAKALQPDGPGFMWSMRPGGWCLHNVHLGVSVENQKYADERIPLLLQTPAAVRFISAEPLLGPVDIGLDSATCSCCPRWPSRWVRVNRPVTADFPIALLPEHRGRVAAVGVHRAESNQHGALCVNGLGLRPSEFDALPALDWVIVGGESGPGARPFDLAWARSIVSQCKAAGVAVFYKQGGSSNRCKHDSKGGCLECVPADLRIREFPHAHV